MTYPQQSNWNSPQPLSGWITHTERDGEKICSGDGWNLLGALQSELYERLSERSLVSYDGTAVDASTMQVNAPGSATGWDVNLLRGLWAIASAYHAPSQALDAIAADARAGSGTVSPGTFAAGVWISAFAGTTSSGVAGYVGTLTDIGVPEDAILPSMDQAPPAPPNAAAAGITSGLTCNAVPPGTVALGAVRQGVVQPFNFNLLYVLGGIVLVAGGIVAFLSFVPHKSTQRRSSTRRSRRARRRS